MIGGKSPFTIFRGFFLPFPDRLTPFLVMKGWSAFQSKLVTSFRYARRLSYETFWHSGTFSFIVSNHSFDIHFVTENLSISYLYKKSPRYSMNPLCFDKKLTKNVLCMIFVAILEQLKWLKSTFLLYVYYISIQDPFFSVWHCNWFRWILLHKRPKQRWNLLHFRVRIFCVFQVFFAQIWILTRKMR